jgi:hypothetical protein
MCCSCVVFPATQAEWMHRAEISHGKSCTKVTE